MNHLVRITADEYGDVIAPEDQRWCLASPAPHADALRVTCDGQVLDGNSSVKFESKSVKRGGITCPKCIETVKAFKAVKL